MEWIGWLYCLVALLLGLYSANMLFLTILFWIQKLHSRVSKKSVSPSQASPEPACWPIVTVQLPMYNELQVARRLIDSIARLDYPSSRLQIQVLDDSTDLTRQIAAEAVRYWQTQGVNICQHHRNDRRDFKAGALLAGMASATGEFIAIFDADFIPPPGWLKQAIQPFLEANREKLGFVQTCWSHVNEDYSLLTRAQSLGLDGHFGIEQNVRSQTGFLFNFNGTAGIWRKACIEDIGNWRGDSLAEDLDLSFRAQLRGWEGRYRLDVKAPAELPTLMLGFKRQQFRWTKGSIQVFRLLGKEILRAPYHPVWKLHSLLHVSSYLCHPLMVLLLLLTLPLLIWGGNVLHRLPTEWLGVIGLGPPLFYASSQVALYGGKRIWRWFGYMPLLGMLGVGMAVNNTRAVLEAICRKPNTFERTPKLGDIHQSKIVHIIASQEQLRVDSSTLVELALTGYTVLLGVLAIQHQNWIGAFYFFLYACGFGWVAGETIWEAKGMFRRSRRSKSGFAS